MSTRTTAPPPRARRVRTPMNATDLALVAAFAALIAVLGLAPPLHLFGNAVPITLQSMGVMLAGAVLGARRGAAAVLVLLALCFAGLPVLSGGRGGIGVLAGPTAGYLLGWVLGAALTGWLVYRTGARRTPWGIAVAALVGGVGMVYLCGIPVSAWRTGVDLGTAITGSLVFLPGDLVKAIVTGIVAAAVLRANPRLTAG